MPSIFAVALVFALFLVIALPGVMAVAQPGAAKVAAPFYLLLLAGLGYYHVGLPGAGEAIPVQAAQSGTAPIGLCNQALTQSDAAGLILDRSDPMRVVVRQELWAELPQQAKDALVGCLELARPEQSSETPIEIVEQGR